MFKAEKEDSVMNKEEQYILRAINRLFQIKTEDETSEEMLGYDWGVILYQSVLHKIVPIIYGDLIKNNLIGTVSNQIYKVMKNITDISKYHNRVLQEQAELILRQATQENIEMLILKGPILADFLYDDSRMRIFGDLDILVEKTNLPQMKELLTGNGYVQGSYDKSLETIIPVSRREIIERELYTHETVEFHKINEDSYMTDLVIDVNHAVSWKEIGNIEKISVKDFMEKSCMYNVQGVSMPGPIPERLFIHTCMHLYSEAVFFCWQYSWHKNFGDVELKKYIDIGLFLKKKIDWECVVEEIRYFGVEEQIIYVLTQFKQLFPEVCLPNALLNYIGDVTDTGYYYTCRGDKKTWTLSIKERVFNQAGRKQDVLLNTEEGDMMIKRGNA